MNAMRLPLFSLIVMLLFAACGPADIPSPNKTCSAEVETAGIQCESRLPLLEFSNGSFGEVTNPEDFPEIFSSTDSPEKGKKLIIGWEESTFSEFPFILCNVARTPSTYIKILCLSGE